MPAEPSIWTLPPPPPRQRALGRDEIVAAAIALADEGGMAAVTMKAVATSLGPYTAMALYRYVHSREGLTDLMLDAVVAEVPVPVSPGADWRTDLHALALATRRMLGRHPWCALLTHTRPPLGPHLMRRLEFTLAVLTTRGASLADAMAYAALLDRHVLGSGAQEAEEARHEPTGAAFTAALASARDLAAADGTVPLLTEWLTHPSGPPRDAQFELGLGFLLDGIESRLPAR
ncbi:TetR/AcrR family transcriptional regulator C-terminal domain-containing protein [Amycolatopsis sp. NPDC051903]|uniref:TetR/AcrR family transcriptional regulator C-terminal domain-containing protein n=1 Tax=Amycolatopsis sp. NPDC051903 TaxID=3363936 RepID=UPI0037B24C5B